MSRILITGGSGKIGSRLVQRLGEFVSSQDKVFLLKHQRNLETDFTYAEVIDALTGTYDFALHLAANTHTKMSNMQEYRAGFIADNIELTRRICERSGRVLLVSTDNVFSGEDQKNYMESDSPNPCNFYGATKAEAEKVVLDKKGAVIRIQSMIGIKSNLIVDKVLDALDGKEYWPFWDDTFNRPTYFEDFLAVVKRVAPSTKSGIYHVSCQGDPISRAGIAQKVLDAHLKLGLPIQRQKLNSEHCTVEFPRRLVLDTQKTQQELGYSFTDLYTALEHHVLGARGVC